MSVFLGHTHATTAHAHRWYTCMFTSHIHIQIHASWDPCMPGTHDPIMAQNVYMSIQPRPTLRVSECVCVPVCVFVPDLLPHFMCLCVACTACVWACLWRSVQPNRVKRTLSYVHVYKSCVCMLVTMCPTLPCPNSCSFDAFRTRMHSLCPFALLLSPPRSSRAYT